MFDIGWSELIVIGIVALVVIGPKELPGVLRMVGQWVGKVRRMAAEFQGQFQEAMREAEMAELKKQVDDIRQTADDLAGQFDPLGNIREETERIEAPAAAAAGTPVAAAPVVGGANGGALPPAASDPASPPAPESAERPPRAAAGGGGA